MQNFDDAAYEAFREAALEKYAEDYASSSCAKGERMVFGKCRKVGGSSGSKDVATIRTRRSLRRLSNQRRRKAGLPSRYSRKGFKD